MVVFSLVASVFTAIGFSAAVAGYLANTLVALGLNLLTSSLNKPKPQSRTAIQSEIETGGDIPVSTVYGRAKMEGHWIHYNKYGNGNSVNQFVFVLANGWCDGLEPYVIIGDEKRALVSIATVNNEIARYYVEGWDDHIVIRFYDGRPGQAADPELVNNANPPENWDNTAVCAGLCYVSVDQKFDATLHSAGIPKIEFILRGLRLYDWRKDSSVAGGSGTHRLADPATWEYSENPAVQRFNYELGVKGLSSGRALIGPGKPMASLDLASYTFSANACDVTRTLSGESVPSYICGMRVFSEDAFAATLDLFDDAMSGYAVERSGLSGVVAGAPQVPVMELTDAHLRTNAGFAEQPRRGRTDRVNILSGGYVNPDQLWEIDSYTPVEDANALAVDKIPLNSQLDLPQVPSAAHAQYVAENRYRQNRRMHQVPGLPVTVGVLARLEVGDWVTRNGKTWLVTRTEMDERRDCFIDLAETEAAIYGETGRLSPPVTVPVTLPQAGNLQLAVTGLTIQQTVVENVQGPA